MGSTQSKNNNDEEALSHFKHRIQFIKQAISSRKAFSAALTAYAVCLKNTGAALTGAPSDHPSSVHFLPPPPPLLPPPPPLPPQLQRATVLPKVKLVPPTIMEVESELEDEQLTTNSGSSSGDARRSEQKLKGEATRGSNWDNFFGTDDLVATGKGQKPVEFAIPVRPVVKKRGATTGCWRLVTLKQIFMDVDDHFLIAFESTLEVSRMLEASNNRVDDGLADANKEETEALTTVLDKMLAKENKLYDQANAWKVIKYEYQKTVSLIDKQKKKKGSNTKSLVKLNTAISHLHTRYIVETQSVVSTIAEINCTRDSQLYSILVQLVDGMARMWNTMLYHHESQAKIVYSLKSIVMETSEYDYDSTIQLCGAIRDWHTQFCRIIVYQKYFISALHSWSKLSLTIPFQSNLEEKVSSPSPVQNTQIHALLVSWKNDLDNLPDEVARNAIRNFAAVTQTIVDQQEEDLKTRERCKVQKELDSKRTHFQNGGNEELNPDNPLKDAKEEKESVIIVPKQLEVDDEEACQKDRKAARHIALASLRYSLVEVFSAMSGVAKACSDMYYNLRYNWREV